MAGPQLAAAAAAARAPPQGDVTVTVEAPSFSSRRLVAATPILAPPERVWEALTDYDGLGTFIPSLVENRCLERRERGAVLYQVGAQDVALGVKFRAACTLEIREHPRGLPPRLLAPPAYQPPAPFGFNLGFVPPPLAAAGSSAYPWPSQSLPGQPVLGDLTFDLVKGDFEAFRGLWRVQQGVSGPASAWLVYCLHVRPQAWLPVGLIQDRISREVVTNLRAVRRHVEVLHHTRPATAAAAAAGQRSRQTQQPQQQPQQRPRGVSGA